MVLGCVAKALSITPIIEDRYSPIRAPLFVNTGKPPKQGSVIKVRFLLVGFLLLRFLLIGLLAFMVNPSVVVVTDESVTHLIYGINPYSYTTQSLTND